MQPSEYLDEIDQPAVTASTTDAVDDADWESPEVTNQPADKSTSNPASEDDGDGDAEGDSQDADTEADDDAGWDDKPAAAAVDEDKDPKGRIPSWRVREIREQKDREIADARREAQEAKEELARVRSGAPAKSETANADVSIQADRDRVIAVISERDPVIKDADAKLNAIQHLVENAPEELVKYFRNADHMAAEVAKLTSLRETRLNAHLTKIETDHANEVSGREKAQTEYTTKLVTDYDAAIKSSKIPNITKYASRLASNADRLHIGIRELLLNSDDKDVLTAAIGSNKAFFDELAAVDPRKPLTHVQLAAIGVKLGKAVSAYNNKPKGSFVDDDEPAPKAVQPTSTRRSTRAPTSAGKYRVDRDGTIVIP